MSECCKIRLLLSAMDFLIYSKMSPKGAMCRVTFEMKLKYWCEGLFLQLMELERYCSEA